MKMLKRTLGMETPGQSLYFLNISFHIKRYLCYKLHHDFDNGITPSVGELGHLQHPGYPACQWMPELNFSAWNQASLLCKDPAQEPQSPSSPFSRELEPAEMHWLTCKASFIFSCPCVCKWKQMDTARLFFLKTLSLILHITFKWLDLMFHRAAQKKDTRQLLHLTPLDKIISHDLPAATLSLILSTV